MLASRSALAPALPARTALSHVWIAACAAPSSASTVARAPLTGVAGVAAVATAAARRAARRFRLPDRGASAEASVDLPAKCWIPNVLMFLSIDSLSRYFVTMSAGLSPPRALL